MTPDEQAVERVREWLGPKPRGTVTYHTDHTARVIAVEDLVTLAALAQPKVASDGLHLSISGKTFCGQWVTPDVKSTISVRACNCRPCLEGYAASVEGDSDNPERVAAANRIYEQAAALPTQPKVGDGEVRTMIDELREGLRVHMLEQPTTGIRETYSDGFAMGLCEAIRRIDDLLERLTSPTKGRANG